MLVGALYNIVDQVFIGQGVGYLANAATNVAFPFTIGCLAVSLLIGNGGAANQSLFLGAGDRISAGKVVGNGIGLLILSGLCLSAVSLLFLNPLLRLFGATGEIFGYARTYAGITAFGFPLLILSGGLNSYIRADGSPNYAMAGMLSGAVINTALDPLFIFGFRMGIAGAAYATVISQAASCAVSLFYVPRFRHIRVSPAGLRFHGKLCLSILSLGAASSVNQVSMFVVSVVMNNSLSRYGARSVYGSEIPLAVAGIINKVNMVFFSVVIGIAIGSQPIIGFNYGAKEYARVRETFRLAAMAASFVSVLSFFAFQLFPREIISLFGRGNEAYFQFAERYFRVFLLMAFANGIQPVVGNFFTYIGKAEKGIFITLTRQILFFLPLIFILPLFWGMDGIMASGPLADATAALAAAFMVRGELKSLRERENEK